MAFVCPNIAHIKIICLRTYFNLHIFASKKKEDCAYPNDPQKLTPPMGTLKYSPA